MPGGGDLEQTVAVSRALKALGAGWIKTIALGLITEARQAEEIIASGKADLRARGMLYDPRWGWHAAAALGAQVQAPPPYWRAPAHDYKNLFGETAYGAR